LGTTLAFAKPSLKDMVVQGNLKEICFPCTFSTDAYISGNGLRSFTGYSLIPRMIHPAGRVIAPSPGLHFFHQYDIVFNWLNSKPSQH